MEVTRTRLIKLTGPAHYQVADHGVEGSWQGAPLGERTFTRRAVTTPADWASFRTGITRTEEEVVTAAASMRRALPAGVPLLVTVFAPATQAMMLAEPATFAAHVQSSPGIVRDALDRITRQTADLIRRFAHAGANGIFLVSKHHDPSLINETDYQCVMAPSDRMTIEACRCFPANIFHLHGSAAHGSGWPLAGHWIIHVEPDSSNPAWTNIRAQTRHPVLVTIPYEAWEQGAITPRVRAALDQLGQRSAIIGAPCAVPLRYAPHDIARWVNKVEECHAALVGA